MRPLISPVVVRRQYARLSERLQRDYSRVRSHRNVARAFDRVAARAAVAGDRELQRRARACAQVWRKTDESYSARPRPARGWERTDLKIT